jgi:predicted nucleotidyltransferase
MRLRAEEVDSIKRRFSQVFREGSVSLFGSRIDDAKRGGDIDLFLEVPDKRDLFKKKVVFLARLKQDIGDRRIDVVFDEDATRLIEQEARRWAIPL